VLISRCSHKMDPFMGKRKHIAVNVFVLIRATCLRFCFLQQNCLAYALVAITDQKRSDLQRKEC